MARQILFDNQAKEKLLKGLDIAADAVSGTLGPMGRNAFIEQQFENIITNDGATIASAIDLPDKFENMGAGIIRNVSSQTNDTAGDGTTTTALLTQAIIHEALGSPENPMEVRNSLNEVGKKVIESLKNKSKTTTEADLFSVAKVSAENDEIAKLIVDLLAELGENSVVNIDDSPTTNTFSQKVAGYDAPVGFISPYFINERQTGKAVFKDVHVLVCEKKMSNYSDMRFLAEQFEKEGIGQCVIVCDDIDDAMVGFFVQNKLKGVFQSVVIKAHGELLEDIEGAVGATAIADRNGVSFKNVQLKHLGHADSIIVDQNKVTFVGNNPAAALRALELDTMAENEKNEYVKKKMKDRAAKLRGGIGVIKIGAATDFERTYLKLKAEDAIRAVQAALSEGIVEGGGMALWRISKELEDNTIGGQILKKVLKAPLKKICENAGKDYDSIISQFTGNLGYDAKENQVKNLMEAGIIDPTKVERCCIENALSAASTFITSFIAIVNESASSQK